MIPLDVSTIIEALAPGAPSVEGTVTRVTCDSRDVGPGCCFVALRGRRHDASRFVPRALAAGAALAIASPAASPDPRVVRMDDPVAGLATVAGLVRDRFRGPVVGITGSVGKTSVKEFLRQLLPARLAPVLPPRSFNNREGVSRTLVEISEETGLVVVEMGTNAPGEIAALCALARPTLGVLTGIAPAHLEGLESVAGVIVEKTALARALPEGAVLVVNGDDPVLREHPLPPGLALRRAGLRPGDGIVAPADPETGAALVLGDGTRLVHALPTRVQQRNLWIAVQTALALGVTPAELAGRTPDVRPAPLRGERRIVGGATVVLDCYNANPVSMAAALDDLAALPGPRIAVVGEMLELGAERARWHEDLGERLARLAPDAALFVGPSAEAVRAGAGGGAASWLVTRPDVDAARGDFARLLARGGSILLKASRGIALERLLEPGDG